jgi:hypothetical protein
MNAPIDGLSVEFHRGRALLDLPEVNQGNLKGDTDLGGGKTDALRLSHRIFKDSRKLHQLVIGWPNRCGCLA